MDGNGVVTVDDIATTTVGSAAADPSVYTNTAALSADGKTLILQISATDDGQLNEGESFGDVTGLTVLKDMQANAMADSAVNASGAI